MDTDSTSPIDPETDLLDPQLDPHLRELLQRRQVRPGPYPRTGTLQDVAARTDAAWDALAARSVARATAGSSSVADGTTHARRFTSARQSWRMATVACLLVVLGIGTWVWTSPSHESSTQTFATKPGQQRTVRLADGSTMLLAPATSVSITGTSVKVLGAVYFNVAPHTSRPLTVQTRNAGVQVLGTRFEVRQFADEPLSRVVVEDGRVALHSRLRSGGQDNRMNTARNQAVASAGMMAMISDSGVTLTSGVATQALTGWVRGTLVFDGVPLREVAAEVGRVYGVNVRVADSVLATTRVSAEVDVRQWSLVDVLSMLGEVMAAHYVEDRGAFVLVPGRRVQNDGIERKPDHRFPQPERQYGR